MKKVKRYDGEEESLVDTRDYGGSSGTGEYAPAPAAPKQRIVTKEELAKSGLSLRDFLNKERGLTRRGEPAKAPEPVKAPPAPETVTEKTTTTSVSAPAKKDSYYSPFTGKVEVKKSAAEREAEMAARRERAMSAVRGIGDIISKAKQNYESTRPVSREVEKQRKQAMERGNLAKGGKVSSASSRADGIAQRGKTRGKMC
jgi:hypothetical protein